MSLSSTIGKGLIMSLYPMIGEGLILSLYPTIGKGLCKISILLRGVEGLLANQLPDNVLSSSTQTIIHITSGDDVSSLFVYLPPNFCNFLLGYFQASSGSLSPKCILMIPKILQGSSSSYLQTRRRICISSG